MSEATVRERLYAALAGETVERPVLAVYDWFVKNRDLDWQALFGRGLGQVNHADLVELERPNVEVVEELSEVDGRPRRDVTWKTDLGELHEWYLGEWRQEHFIKGPADYRIMARAYSDAVPRATCEHFESSEARLGGAGITLGQIGRTPAQHIQIDLTGLERFSLDIADERPELLELMELLTDLKLREFSAALETPARHIKLWENLSIETMGPALYARHLVPVYEKIFELLDGTGRRLHVHYDGQLRAISDFVSRLPFDGLDSITPPPEGDVEIAEARRLWPGKFFWLHPTLTWYRLPQAELVAKVRAAARAAGPERYCLMISEEVPPDVMRTVPAVLEGIAEGQG